jgi:hypothetical protein
MSIRFIEDVHGYKKGQVVENLGGGVEDAYVNSSQCAVFVHEDGTETDGAGKLFHVCPHCDGTGRAKSIDGPPKDKMVKRSKPELITK